MAHNLSLRGGIRMRVRNKRLRKKLAIALLLTFFGSVQETAFGVIQGGNFKPGFNFFSRDTDIQEGQKAAAEVNSKLPLINDPAIVNYVNELGRRLATVAPNNYNYPW